MSLTLGWFLGRAADLTNIKRGRYRDDAGVDFPINAEHPDQRTALLAAFGPLGTEAALQEILAKLIATPATAAAQETQRVLLAQIAASLTAEGGYLDGVEGLLTTGNGSLASILAALARVKVQADYAASGLTPVTQEFSANAAPAISTGQSATFTPPAGRGFKAWSQPVGFTGSYQLECQPIVAGPWVVVLPYSIISATPEIQVITENQTACPYRWNVTARTAGSVTVGIAA